MTIIAKRTISPFACNSHKIFVFEFRILDNQSRWQHAIGKYIIRCVTYDNYIHTQWHAINVWVIIYAYFTCTDYYNILCTRLANRTWPRRRDDNRVRLKCIILCAKRLKYYCFIFKRTQTKILRVKIVCFFFLWC